MTRSRSKPHFCKELRAVAFAISCFVLLTACSQVNPEISPAEDLPPLIVDDSAKTFSSKAMNLLDVTITGKVSKYVLKLQYSPDNGTTWADLTSGLTQSLNFDQTVCAELCPFTFGVNDIGTKISALAALPVGGEAKVLLRGIGQFGKTGSGEVTFKRIKGGFISVGAVNFTERGLASKSVTGRFKVVGARFEADKVKASTSFKAVGAFQ